LFSDADDPLAALRWTLSEIRKAAGWSADELGGDPLTLALPDGHLIDIIELTDARKGGSEPEALGNLLGSLTFDAVPAFDFWLRAQQLHLSSRQQTRLRDRVLADLATGRFDDALRRARRLVDLDCQGPVGCARWRTVELPGRGQQNCPVTARCCARAVQVVSGVTPLPPVAWVRRMLSPVVMTTCAWCRSRSTVAFAMVLGMSSSKPAG